MKIWIFRFCMQQAKQNMCQRLNVILYKTFIHVGFRLIDDLASAISLPAGRKSCRMSMSKAANVGVLLANDAWQPRFLSY